MIKENDGFLVSGSICGKCVSFQSRTPLEASLLSSHRVFALNAASFVKPEHLNLSFILTFVIFKYIQSTSQQLTYWRKNLVKKYIIIKAIWKKKSYCYLLLLWELDYLLHNNSQRWTTCLINSAVLNLDILHNLPRFFSGDL